MYSLSLAPFNHIIVLVCNGGGEWTFFVIMEAAFGMHAQQFSGAADSFTTQRFGCKPQVSLVSY